MKYKNVRCVPPVGGGVRRRFAGSDTLATFVSDDVSSRPQKPANLVQFKSIPATGGDHGRFMKNFHLKVAAAPVGLEIVPPGLNLCSSRAFHWMNMPEVADTEQLPVAQARAGDPAAWDTLFRRYQLPLYVYVFELVRHEQAGLDLVQETFIAAVKHLSGLREDGKFGSWLFGIAHQKCLQHWRKRTEVLFDEVPEPPEDFETGPDDQLIQRESEAEFMKLLEQLPLPHRAVLLLHYIEDFPLEEIARITETRVGTVKSRLHYAKRALRKLVEQK